MSTPETQAPNIYQKMLEVMRRVSNLYKADYNPHHKFRFVNHDDVTQALRAEYVRVGIIREVTVLETQRHDTSHGLVASLTLAVAWVNADRPEDRVVVNITTESQPGGKGGPTPQQIGSAISYGVKMLELKNFSLVGDDSPDTDQAAKQAADVEPPAGSYDYYCAGFDNVATQEQLGQLMAEIASKRGNFTAQQIKVLTQKWEQTKARLA